MHRLSVCISLFLSGPPGGEFYSSKLHGGVDEHSEASTRRGTRATSAEVVRSYRAGGRPNCEKKDSEEILLVDVATAPVGGPSPKSSVRLVRHARARIPNDVRVREGDYFVGSLAPQTQGRKEERKRARKSEISISMDLFRWSHQKLTLRFALDCDPRWQHPWLEEASSGACLCA